MSETISPNTTIAQYTIVSKIGEGGMGEVWRARDAKLGRDVAIKVLPAAFSENSERLRRFEQEAQAAGALNHPNILVIHHIDIHDGAPYIVSELLEGEELREHLNDRAIPQRRAIQYEMITGHRAFRRETMAETMTAILKEEPEELTESNPNISPSLERIVRRCLEKKPERRFQSTSDLGFALEALSAPTSSSGSAMTRAASAAVEETRRSAWISRLPWIAAGTFALIAAILGIVYFAAPLRDQQQVIRLSFEPPADLSMNDVQADAAVISRDGQKIAFSAWSLDGKYMLYVRDLSSAAVKMLPGSDLPLAPFWSPDSKTLAYGSLGKLKRSDISGGNAQVLTDAPRLVAGAWNKNGDIIFCPDYGGAMYQISANGGEPKQITFQEANGDGQHSGGTFLPDGKHFLFTRTAASPDLRGVWLGSLDSKETKRILAESTPVRFAPPDGPV